MIKYHQENDVAIVTGNLGSELKTISPINAKPGKNNVSSTIGKILGVISSKVAIGANSAF